MTATSEIASLAGPVYCRWAVCRSDPVMPSGIRCGGAELEGPWPQHPAGARGKADHFLLPLKNIAIWHHAASANTLLPLKFLYRLSGYLFWIGPRRSVYSQIVLVMICDGC